MASQRGFEEHYREHYPYVYNLCRKLLASNSLAEDAAQETFMRAYSNFDRYDSQQPFRGWVSTIANNYCIDLLRRRNRESWLFAANADDMEPADSDGPQPLAGSIEREEAGRVSAALDTLPDKYRIPLVLFFYEDNSYREIATLLDIDRNHAGVLILRGKKMLRQALGGRDDNGSLQP